MLATQFHFNRLANSGISTPVPQHYYIKPLHLLNEWLEEAGFVTGITYVSQHSTGNKIAMKFRLSEKYEGQFIWIRGFISLGNHFKISADRQQRIFSLTLDVNRVEGFRSYLDMLVRVLQNELIFRAELKQLIKLNVRYTRLENAIKYK